MERNLVLGVDAGSANVVAAVAEIAGGEPQVIGVGLVPSAGVHRGVVVDVKAAGGVIRQAVEKACQMADCSGANRAVVSVSGAHILSLVGSAEVPVHRPLTGVAPEDVRRALDAAAAVELPAGREVIHVAARSYRLDGNGPMREPLKAGLARADAVVVMLPTDVDEADPELLAVFGALPVFVARLTPEGPPPSGPQVGFAGIAKPWKVERSLKAAGCDLADFVPFPDHAAYSAETMAFLTDRAAVFDAGLVTTEKDWVRLTPDQRAHVTAWPVVARFDQMSTPFAALVWGRVLLLDTLDTAKILDFYRTEGERGAPEPQCAPPSPAASPEPPASPSPSPS